QAPLLNLHPRSATPAKGAWFFRQGSESRLTDFGAEDVLQVLEVPSGDFSTKLDAGFARGGAGFGAAASCGWPWGAFGFLRGSDLIDGEMADDRHVGCAVALAQPGLVLVEDDVEHPVQLVFDPPMAADGCGGGLGRERRRGDIIAGLETAAILQLGLAFDPYDRGDVGQPQLAGEPP